MNQLVDIEILSSGTWNDHTFTDADLAALAETTEAIPLVLGHDEELFKSTAYPKCGVLESIRQVGNKLLASFSDVPDAIYQAIKDKLWDRVSCVINLAGDRPVLKQVGLLGGSLPACKDLLPIMLADSDDGCISTIMENTDTIADLRQQLATLKVEKRRQTTIALCDDLVRTGKVLPAELDAGMVDFALSLDAEIKLADDSTQYQKFFAILKNRPSLLHLSEKLPTSEDKTETEEYYEKNKAFFDRYKVNPKYLTNGRNK